jgi:hypothetical protein
MSPNILLNRKIFLRYSLVSETKFKERPINLTTIYFPVYKRKVNPNPIKNISMSVKLLQRTGMSVAR